MPKNNSKAMRDVRRAEAKERQAQRDKRGPGEQIALLETRRGFSNKETHRLLIAAKAAVETTVAPTPAPKPKRTRKREVTQ